MKNLNIKQLRELATEFKIKGRASMNKAQLVEAIENLPMSYIEEIRNEQEAERLKAEAEFYEENPPMTHEEMVDLMESHVPPMTEEEAQEIEKWIAEEEEFEGRCAEYEMAEALANEWVEVQLKYGVVHGKVVDVDFSNVYVETMTGGRYKFHHSECTVLAETKPHNTKVEVLEKINWSECGTVLHHDVMELIEGRGQVTEEPKRASADFTEWSQAEINWLIDWLGNGLEYKQCVVYERSEDMIELWCDAEDNDGDYFDIEIIKEDDKITIYDRIEGAYKFEKVVSYPKYEFLHWASGN